MGAREIWRLQLGILQKGLRATASAEGKFHVARHVAGIS